MKYFSDLRSTCSAF